MISKSVSSKIVHDAREKIFKILFPHATFKRQSDHEMIDQILALSGTTDIECPECKGKRFSLIVDNGPSVPCDRCFGTGKGGEYKWKVSVVLENGELPKDELAELVIRQTEIVGMEGARPTY